MLSTEKESWLSYKLISSSQIHIEFYLSLKILGSLIFPHNLFISTLSYRMSSPWLFQAKNFNKRRFIYMRMCIIYIFPIYKIHEKCPLKNQERPLIWPPYLTWCDVAWRPNNCYLSLMISYNFIIIRERAFMRI